MNREEIIELAREAGDWNGQTAEFNDVGLERFANLVAAKERERCAKECEKLSAIESYEAVGDVAKECAEAIRALPPN